MKKLLQIGCGLLLVITSLWIGAYGQQQTGALFGDSYYAWPAFYTALIFFFFGAVLIIAATND